MQPRTVGQMPATAEGTAPEDVQTAPLAPRWAAATSGQRLVCFMEAAPGVFAPFWGLGWGVERLGVTAPSGRQRLKGLAALHATTRDLLPVRHLPSLTSDT